MRLGEAIQKRDKMYSNLEALRIKVIDIITCVKSPIQEATGELLAKTVDSSVLSVDQLVQEYTRYNQNILHTLSQTIVNWHGQPIAVSALQDVLSGKEILLGQINEMYEEIYSRKLTPEHETPILDTLSQYTQALEAEISRLNAIINESLWTTDLIEFYIHDTIVCN